MSNYKLVTVDQRFFAETVAETGSEELMRKANRSYVGMYDDTTNWYIPLRARINKNKPDDSFYLTPFNTENTHFHNPGLDFQKALYVPDEFVIDINNKLPKDQSDFINRNINDIQISFEKYVFKMTTLDKSSREYKWSTIHLFPEGIEEIVNQVDIRKQNEQFHQYLNNGGLER